MQSVDLVNYIKDIFGVRELSKLSIAEIDSYVSKVNLKDFIEYSKAEVLKEEYRYITPFQKFLAISDNYTKMKQKERIKASLECKQGFLLDLIKKVENYASVIENKNAMARTDKEVIILDNLGKVLVYAETKTPIFSDADIKALKSVSNNIYVIIELVRNKELKSRLEDVWIAKSVKVLEAQKQKKTSDSVTALLNSAIKRM